MFAEFSEGVQKATEEFNVFLKEKWGLSSVDELAPAVLLFYRRGDRAMVCYPMVLRQEASRTMQHALVAIGEPSEPAMIIFAGFTSNKLDGEKWKLGLSLMGKGSEDYYLKDAAWSEYDQLYLPSQSLRVRKFRLENTEPLLALRFGEVMNKRSREVKEMLLLYFRPLNFSIDTMAEFNTARWLFEAAKSNRYELGGLREDAPRSGHVMGLGSR